MLAEGKAYKSYVTEEELAAERERQEVAGETPRYINEYLGMSEEEKAAYIEKFNEFFTREDFIFATWVPTKKSNKVKDCFW